MLIPVEECQNRFEVNVDTMQFQSARDSETLHKIYNVEPMVPFIEIPHRDFKKMILKYVDSTEANSGLKFGSIYRDSPP